MRIKKSCLMVATLGLCFCAVQLQAVKAVPPAPLDLFERGIEAYCAENWDEAKCCLGTYVRCFTTQDLRRTEAALYLGIAEYHCGDLKSANEAFDVYLAQPHSATHFFTVMEYKFASAEALRRSAIVRTGGLRSLLSGDGGTQLALDIYDQIVLSMPSNPLAARSLYAKAELLTQQNEFDEAILAYQMLLRRFPTHELTPQAYRQILQVYVLQAKVERSNFDVLPLAEIALERFRAQFPRDEGLVEAEEAIKAICEVYADTLYQQGQFYERIEAPRAATVCYMYTVRQFPQTSTARCCYERLRVLAAYLSPALVPSVEAVQVSESSQTEQPTMCDVS
jgi:outer membrane protein assembly factor BamD (BamD/ComL family)